MVAVTQAASEQAHDFATAYQDKVVDYCVEWERTVTAHVDTELAVTNTSQERLNHYQSKIVELNKKMENYNKKSAKVPKKFSEKLARNEIKLNKAHEEYERSASVLCNLIEEVTLRGWKDLYPLVKENIKLEVARAVGENAVFNKLSEVVEELNEAFNNIQSSEQYVSQDSTASATGESNSRITGPFYLVGDASAQSAISEFNRGEARAFPDRNDRPKDDLMRKSENNVPVEQVTTQLPSTLENSESEVETTGPFHAMYDAPREEREDSISATTSLFSEAPASPNRNHAQEDGPVVALEINLTPLVETPRQENRGRESGIMQSFNSVGAVAGKNI